MYFGGPCECPVCSGEETDATREMAGCDYAGTTRRARRRFATYRVYVEEGNTPLTDLPGWVAEIARLAMHYRSQAQRKDYHDQKERERAQSLQRQYGLT